MLSSSKAIAVIN